MSSFLQQMDAAAPDIAGYRLDDDTVTDKALIQSLLNIATIVREAEKSSAPDLNVIVNKAGDMFNDFICWAYSDGHFDFLPSFAHDPSLPPVQDEFNPFGSRVASALMQFAESLLRMDGQPLDVQKLAHAQSMLATSNWLSSHPPHPQSTRLSRFRDNVPISVSDTTPHARTIYQARCEILSDTIASPITAILSSDSSALVLACQAGWKNRDPYLTIHRFDDDKDEFGTELSVKCGLSSVAYHAAVDTERKLALIADESRVKTYFWGAAGDVSFGSWQPKGGTNVHTLDSKRYDGPLVVLPDGRIVRAGKGGAMVWNIDRLDTHEGGKLVGGSNDVHAEDTWRDDADEIELSVGDKASMVIKFEDEELSPSPWHLHQPTGHMLVAEGSHKDTGRYGCYALDLENNGRKVARFLGHGGDVEAFSTSPGDANVFATGGSDGYARLYDVRHSLPVLTLDAGRLSEYLPAVQLVHPDGLPTLFTGGQSSQCIKTWDIRARAMVYELSTGNNAVSTLVWDDKRTTLWAATECLSIDRMGRSQDYRRARIPKWASLSSLYPKSEDPDAMEDDDDEEYDSEDDLDGDHAWPKNAYHDEAFFGYAYDAGDHALVRYQFKEDPNVKTLPVYGNW